MKYFFLEKIEMVIPYSSLSKILFQKFELMTSRRLFYVSWSNVVQQLNCFFVAFRLVFLGFHFNTALSVELRNYHCSGGRSGSQSIYLLSIIIWFNQEDMSMPSKIK